MLCSTSNPSLDELFGSDFRIIVVDRPDRLLRHSTAGGEDEAQFSIVLTNV